MQRAYAGSNSSQRRSSSTAVTVAKDVMTTLPELCQACQRTPVEVVVEEDDPTQPYRVCRACARRLHLHSLRPLEWFNLAAVHGQAKYLLHDDFYWDNGIAQQP